VTVQVLRAILALNDDAYTAVLGAGFYRSLLTPTSCVCAS
jgi:hypothetical protein